MRENGRNGKNGAAGAHDSYSSHPIIPPRGDYQTLHSYQKAEVVYLKDFLEQGGLRERMFQARLQHRRQHPPQS